MIVVAIIYWLVRPQAVNQNFERNKIMTSIFTTLIAKEFYFERKDIMPDDSIF